MLLPSPFIIIGASPLPLIEILTTAGDTRAASGAKDSGAAPAAQIGAKAARPEKIARGRARQKPMGLSSKRKRRDALRPAEDLDFRTYAERRNLLRRILRLAGDEVAVAFRLAGDEVAGAFRLTGNEVARAFRLAGDEVAGALRARVRGSARGLSESGCDGEKSGGEKRKFEGLHVQSSMGLRRTGTSAPRRMP